MNASHKAIFSDYSFEAKLQKNHKNKAANSMCKLCKFLFILQVIHGALNAYVASLPNIWLNAVLWNQMGVKLLQ